MTSFIKANPALARSWLSPSIYERAFAMACPELHRALRVDAWLAWLTISALGVAAGSSPSPLIAQTMARLRSEDERARLELNLPQPAKRASRRSL